MGKVGILAVTVALWGGVQASWYWPFGSDAIDEKPKRVSELVEPASLLIEEGSDLASEGKTDEAIEKYRKALSELDRIELENPDRAKKPEFATLRNKRAYVNAAIDSLLLNQVQSNAKAVAVSDTTELERRLERERWGTVVDRAMAAIDRHDPQAALAELEKARAGTTNAAMIAMTYCAAAGACCQKGAFDDARRVLARARGELARAGAFTEEERRLLLESLKNVRSGIVSRHAHAVGAGRKACEGSARLTAMEDLSAPDAVATADGVLASLGTLHEAVELFVFPEARNLYRVSSNLFLRASVLRKRLERGGKNRKWDLDVSDLKRHLEPFDALSSEIRGIDEAVSAALKSMGAESEKTKVRGRAAGERQVAEAPKKRLESPVAVGRSSKPLSKREQAMSAISARDWTTAKRLIDEMLVEKPNGAVALNLKAAMEARQGKLKEAEATLDRAILSNPRNHFAYYNMANLMLQTRPGDTSVARRYYETGRAFGGPVDARLEERLK